MTDADLLLGHLNPVALLGGDLPVHREAARAAVQARIATPLGLSVEEAAASIVRIVNESMASALRMVSVERGQDPRTCTLVAFGGAGPVHAAALAESLDIPEVMVPPVPGGFSALGLVATDLRRDWVQTFYERLSEVKGEALEARFRAMEAVALASLERAGIGEEDRLVERFADCRYPRQAYELTVPVPRQADGRADLEGLGAAFHALHERTYGHHNPDEDVRIVSLRVTATGHLGGLALASAAGGQGRGAPLEDERAAWFPEAGFVPTPVRDRAALARGEAIPGPLIVEEVDTTVVVPPGWIVQGEARGTLRLTREGP